MKHRWGNWGKWNFGLVLVARPCKRCGWFEFKQKKLGFYRDGGGGLVGTRPRCEPIPTWADCDKPTTP